MATREQLALDAFEGREFLYLTDLPHGVGQQTMARLLERNVVQVVEMQNSRFEKLWALRLVH